MIVWVLVVVMAVDDVVLTAATEVEFRSECLDLAAKAKIQYPNIVKHTCTPYELITEEDDGELHRSTDE